MKTIFTRSLILVSLLLIPLSGIQAETIRMGYIEFPPVFFTNEKGKAEGTLIDLSQKVLHKAGFDYQMTSFPTKRMAEALVNGEIDLWIGLPTLPQFEGTTLVGKSEVLKITLMAYTLGSKKPIRVKEDLNGKSVIILRGYSYGGWIKHIRDAANQVRYTETDKHELAFKMLKAGRGDYLLNYKMPSEKALKQVAVPDLSSNEISSFGTYFVVSKKNPKAGEILERLEKAYQDLRSSSE